MHRIVEKYRWKPHDNRRNHCQVYLSRIVIVLTYKNRVMISTHITYINVIIFFREQPFFLYRMSYLWYTLVGFLITILIGLLVSWFTGPSKYSCADKRLFTPVVHCFLSSRNYQNKVHIISRPSIKQNILHNLMYNLFYFSFFLQNEAELAKMINDVNSITQTSSKR